MLNGNVFAKIAFMVGKERNRQLVKWGNQHHNPCEWSAILTEEVGESAQEALRVHFGSKQPDQLAEELIQVAAVCFAWLEDIMEAQDGKSSNRT